MDVETAFSLGREIMTHDQWEILAVRRASAARLVDVERLNNAPEGDAARSPWVVEACFHATAVVWDEVFVFSSVEDWTRVREAQEARLPRRALYLRARSPYIPGAAASDSEQASARDTDQADAPLESRMVAQVAPQFVGGRSF